MIGFMDSLIEKYVQYNYIAQLIKLTLQSIKFPKTTEHLSHYFCIMSN